MIEEGEISIETEVFDDINQAFVVVVKFHNNYSIIIFFGCVLSQSFVMRARCSLSSFLCRINVKI